MGQNDEADRDNRIERTRMEQDEVILGADVMKLKRSLEDVEMELRVLAKKESNLHTEIEDAEEKKRKLEEELRLKEEEFKDLRKKIQTMGRG